MKKNNLLRWLCNTEERTVSYLSTVVAFITWRLTLYLVNLPAVLICASYHQYHAFTSTANYDEIGAWFSQLASTILLQQSFDGVISRKLRCTLFILLCFFCVICIFHKSTIYNKLLAMLFPNQYSKKLANMNYGVACHLL